MVYSSFCRLYPFGRCSRSGVPPCVPDFIYKAAGTFPGNFVVVVGGFPGGLPFYFQVEHEFVSLPHYSDGGISDDVHDGVVY